MESLCIQPTPYECFINSTQYTKKANSSEVSKQVYCLVCRPGRRAQTLHHIDASLTHPVSLPYQLKMLACKCHKPHGQ